VIFFPIFDWRDFLSVLSEYWLGITKITLLEEIPLFDLGIFFGGRFRRIFGFSLYPIGLEYYHFFLG